MILVTTGTNGEPFDRLLAAVDRLELDEELVVQHGPSTLRPRGATCFDFVRFDELAALARSARSVVSHGGVGSVLLCWLNGHRPLVVPRLAVYGEAVDDHQLLFARRLEREGLAGLVDDVDRLPELLHTPMPPIRLASTSNLAADLRAYLDTVLADETSA